MVKLPRLGVETTSTRRQNGFRTVSWIVAHEVWRRTDPSLHSRAKLSAIARQLNERPRKTLLYQTPAEKFAECVAAIG
jgi:hypothetical protein